MLSWVVVGDSAGSAGPSYFTNRINRSLFAGNTTVPNTRSLEAPVSKLAVFSSLFALIVMTGVCPSWSLAQSSWQQPALNPNRMSVEVAGKVFDRPGDESSAPVVFNSVTNATLLDNERATDFGSQFGIEVKFTVPSRYDTSSGFEFRTVLVNWDEENSLIGPNLASDFFPDALNPPETFDFDIESDYYSFELVKKRSVLRGLTASGGVRYISTSDLISTTSTSTTAGVVGTQLNDFEATNSLVGLQFGLEYNQPVAQSVFVTIFGRAGGYYNGTEFNTATSASDTAGVTDTTETTTSRFQSTESFVAELGGRVNFRVIPNSGFTTFIGYEATAIDGIALAAANAAPLATGIDTNNTVFFQAITFGAQFVY